MHAKKPQTRLAGSSLAKSLKPKAKKPVKPITASNKQRSIPTSIKSVSSKKLTTKKSTKPKVECENNEKKSKSVNSTEPSGTASKSAAATAVSMGSNYSKEKATNNKKPKSEKKSTTPIRRKEEPSINGEKKSTAAVKDEKLIKSKELKNLDIQLCGYSSMAVTRESTGSDSDTDRIIKASICENVKTKARAASATFNSSGNRSPSTVNSPGPNHSKQSAATNDKPNKNEAALKSTENKNEHKVTKKKEPTKTKSPAKPKPTKSARDEEKNKKSTNENKKTEGDKNANKSQKVKSKPTNETAKNVAPAISTAEKRIEIKTQVDESKSLIDTIADAINEVVKQYKDSNNGDATGPHSASTKTLKKDNKIVKTTKKKVLNEKKLEVIESASDLVKDSKDAIKAISKNAKAKQKLVKDNKTDDKIGEQIKQNSEKIVDKETAATVSKAVSHAAANETTAKQSNDKTNKCATNKSKSKPKPSKKSTDSQQTEAKGSKIIKIDLKSKKKVKSLATVKSASLKLAAKQLQNKTTKEPKVCQDDIKKNDEHKSHANSDEMSDDDNLSLTELKAQLNSKSDTQKTESNAKSSNASTKLVNAVSSSANKQKTTAKNGSFKKPTNSSGGTTGAATSTSAVSAVAVAAPKKKSTNQKETGTTASNKSDVYEFHDANFSGDEIPYVHKKKREKIPSNLAASQESAEKDDAKKTVEKSKTLPLKKQIRHKVMKETAKTTKTDPKPTASTNTKGSSTTRSASDTKIEQGENDQDNKNGETKKSTKAHANNGHKLAAKNRRMKLFGFYSGPKRHRMASLNALAKVQCLYENESRTAQELGFVKEPQNVQRMKIVSDADKNEPNSSSKSHGKDKEVKADSDKKEKNPKKDGDDANIEMDRDDVAVNNRTLRKVPGVRGEGTYWEMENSSMDESDTEKEESQTVSNIHYLS